VDIVPAEDVEVDLANYRVDVTVRHIASRANPIPTFFARVFGVINVNVQAHAAAEAVPANSVGCLTPWAVGDLWDDSWGDGDPGRFDYDDADRSNTPTFGDTFDNYCPCARNADGDIVVDNAYLTNGYGSYVCTDTSGGCTGYGSNFRNDGYTNDVGRPITLKPGNPAQAWSPGWFMAWRPPENMGGADYRENIINCIDEDMFDTGSIVPIDTEPGNMIGPTIQGVEERIGSDPHYWLPGCNGGLGECVYSHTSSCGGTADPCPEQDYSERLLTVPLMDPSEVMRNGLTEIQFRGFMRVFLDNPGSNDITAHIVGLGGAAGSGGNTGDTGAIPLYIRLID
jgi:hypothetical protein